MSKYSTGNYIVTLFDDVGSRLRSVDVISYTAGITLGDQAKLKNECTSYIVLRVVHNSKEPHMERYDVKS